MPWPSTWFNSLCPLCCVLSLHSFGKQLGGRRGCECITLEPSEMIVVDNASEGEEGALQREVSQRHSRRRFRKVNPRGERELITDGQDPTDYVDNQVYVHLHLHYMHKCPKLRE
uniref:Uncharacterized protein n=1 Tax=Hucho hucho TaxID=62062 RepID=A0A4W5JY19_9TELE